MYRISCFIIFILAINFSLLAQDSRYLETKTKTEASTVASTKKSKTSRKSSRKHKHNVYYDRLIVEYKKRMKANVRRYKIIERKMKKPKYSDPSYFGHKRKPKIRPVGKRKYCKECEIVH